MKIVLLTSNLYGGIVQFSMTLMGTLIGRGHEVTCFIPKGYKATIDERFKRNIVTFNKRKSIVIKNSDNLNASKLINNVTPDIVWLMDDSIVSCQIATLLGVDKKKYVTVHDAHFHVSYKNGLMDRVQDRYLQSLRNKTYGQAQKLITLSPRSEEELKDRYPNFRDKVICMPLGAHIPKCCARKPAEIESDRDYMLFIGRIDAYKGIGGLIEAYNDFNGELALIIAGEGNFSEEELRAAGKDNRILILNRYICDEEFIWLIENSKVLVLPYIEATQSGLIPIAYYCGKKVITSAVKGLTQFVEDKTTGYICKTKQDYIDAFRIVSDIADIEDNEKEIKKYYNDRFDWNRNLANIGL